MFRPWSEGDARTTMAGQDCLSVGLAESRESPSGVDGCARRQSFEPVAVDGRRQSNKLGKRLDKNPEKDARAGGGGGITVERVFRKEKLSTGERCPAR